VTGGEVGERPRVCAAVVTHNRLELLQRCVQALRDQSYPLARIVVVDNGSTDDTAAWLAVQSDLVVVRQGPEGTARGLRAAMTAALEQRDCDAIWTADDDARPLPDALERLVHSPAFQAGHVVGSLVVSETDPSRLAFAVPKLSTYSRLFDYYRELTDDVADVRAESGPLGYAWAMFTNGTLLPRTVVEQIGVPIGEFTMGGEEVEYFYRVRTSGFETYLVLDSLVAHPKYPASALPRPKQKFLARNTVYIHRRYRRWFPLRTVFRVVRCLATGRLYLIAPIWHGVRGDFGRNYAER
jgi:rhamnopyranosyl-N-acetylglucosaminyl-diphospho-decaprenol beta-1,3/1,4-galactofuranosyltransferase